MQPSVVGQGYLNTPGLHTATQVEAWRRVTDAVHGEGGVIFAQLMHAGRASHRSLLPGGLRPVGPSAVSPAARVFTSEGMVDCEAPAELTDAEIIGTIGDYRAAALNAREAGFDGVELHGANGYLPHQFLSTNANRRHDRWGGSTVNRIRFTVDVIGAMSDAIGASRVGLRISPGVGLLDITEEAYHDTYRALVEALTPAGLAYLHIAEGRDRDLTLDLRQRWAGVLILNPFTPGGFTNEEHLALLGDRTADMISFGRLFLANPDLPARLAAAGTYNSPDPATFYGGDHHGYTDYPTLNG
jgi:N-ethylmaleimide reductase